jgi:acyl-CoA oxidase
MAAFYHDSDVNTTWEGDNNLLLQQTSKFLMKVINKKKDCTLLPINFIWESLPKEQWADPQLNSLEYIE